MQKIKIENLGAVKYFESNITKYAIIIGEQGTGKSTIAKSIYFFRNVKSELVEYLLSIATNGCFIYDGETVIKAFPSSLNRKLKSIFINLFGYSWNLHGLQMSYDFGNDIYLRTRLEKNNRTGKNFINLEYSIKLKLEINALEKQMKEIYNELKSNISSSIMFATQERNRLNREITEKVNRLFDDYLDTFYIPAGRSLLTLMANQKTRLNYTSIDLVNRNFMNLIESLQPNFDLGIDKVHQHYPIEERNFDVNYISKKIMTCLKGNYRFEKDKEYFEIDKDTLIPLNYASSGQQEMLWILNQLYVLLLSKTKSFVIIEEPEAHLFPKVQKDIIDFIALFANLNDNFVLLTTHSPYVLTSANTLLYAGRLRKDFPDEVNKIMGKHQYFSHDKFSAYLLKDINSINAMPENIVNSDTCEIISEKIDEISEKIGEVYTKLFYLEERYENL